MNAHLDRVEKKLCIGWIKQNPNLFEQNYREFFDQYGEGWTVSAKVRKDCITLVAQRIHFTEQASMSPYDLIMSCPPAQVTRMKMACQAVLSGDWSGAAHHLKEAGADGNTQWHVHAAAKAREYENFIAQTNASAKENG